MSTATMTTTDDLHDTIDGLFVVASAPAGWYEVGDGFRRRWFDGRSWTDYYAPILTPATLDVAPTRERVHTQHGFHAIMTVMTLGMWLPLWAAVTVCNALRTTATESIA